MTSRLRAPAVAIPLLSAGIAVASLPLVAPAPAYDPWAWLLWGREIGELRLSTTEGPAFKPLPVAVCALLAVFGDAAPWLWVALARGASAAAVLLAWRLGRRLAGGSAGGGLLSAAAVFATAHFAAFASAGLSESILLCLALAGVEAGRSGHPRAAMACAAGCALLRVETWPLLALAAVAVWRRRPDLRPLLAVVALLVPLAWFVPELLGSGDVLRSGQRALVPNPGQPALAPIPALASASEALRLVPWAAWPGLAALLALALAGRLRPPLGVVDHPLAPAAVGVAWIAIVAAMAQAGFSGEARYAMPGAALLGIAAGAGWARAAATAPTAGVAVAVVVAVAMVGSRAPELLRLAPAQEHQWRLAQDLERAIARTGGRSAVLACGRPYVGRLRGPLMAYALDVAKARVEPDELPAAPGIVFRSRLTADSAPAPDVPAEFARVARSGLWQVRARCAGPGDMRN